jgi:hypothetical protein
MGTIGSPLCTARRHPPFLNGRSVGTRALLRVPSGKTTSETSAARRVAPTLRRGDGTSAGAAVDEDAAGEVEHGADGRPCEGFFGHYRDAFKDEAMLYEGR